VLEITPVSATFAVVNGRGGAVAYLVTDLSLAPTRDKEEPTPLNVVAWCAVGEDDDLAVNPTLNAERPMSDQPTPSVSPDSSGPPQLPSTADEAAAVPVTQGPPAEPRPAGEGLSTPSADASRYRVGEEIGRGGTGSVRRGHDPALKGDLAVKVLR
jgi:hypothetical protein